MNKAFHIRPCGVGDLAAVSVLYRDLFPDRTGARLGPRTSTAYLRCLLDRRESHEFAIATEGEQVVGFSVLQFDLSVRIPHHWIRSSPREVIGLFFRDPGFLYQRLWRQRRRPGRAQGGGCLRADPPGEKRVLIEWIGVARAAQGRGIGHELLSRSIASARRHQATQLQLRVHIENEAAQRFYERAGFVRLGRSPSEGCYFYDYDLGAETGGAKG